MAFDPYTSPVSFALVAGQRTPGTLTLEGADATTKWDERDGPFLSGAFLVGGGRKLVNFTMRIVLLTSADWAAWYAFRPLVKRPPFGTRPKALDVWHPWLVDQEVRSAVVEKVGQPRQAEDGSFEIAIDWKEFRIPKIALAKPEASTTAPSTDPVDQLIAKLGNQAAEIAK